MGEETVITLLTSFTCQFHPSEIEITGGKDLLDNLIAGISFYVQQFLGGEVQVYRSVAEVIQITPERENHHLQVKMAENPGSVKLDEVQLFDLLDALDQLCLDRQILPDLQLQLPDLIAVPLPLTSWKPAIVGIVTVFVTGLGFYLVPIPKSRLQSVSTPTTQVSPKVLPQATPTLKLITDREKLETLRLQLFDAIDGAWRQTPSFTIPLQYLVTVNGKGDILGYKATAETVRELGTEATAQLKIYREELPLEAFIRDRINKEQFPANPSLTPTPTTRPVPLTNPDMQQIAQFVVTFDPTTYRLAVELPPIDAP